MTRRHSHDPEDRSEAASDSPSGVRLDKWLWAARFYKTRSLAVEAIDGGKVTVNDERAKRSRAVRVGDMVGVRIGPYLHIVKVLALSDRRGGAKDAALLFEETEGSRAAREAMAAHVKAMNLATPYGAGRPTKKDRRAMEEFKRGQKP